MPSKVKRILDFSDRFSGKKIMLLIVRRTINLVMGFQKKYLYYNNNCQYSNIKLQCIKTFEKLFVAVFVFDVPGLVLWTWRFSLCFSHTIVSWPRFSPYQIISYFWPQEAYLNVMRSWIWRPRLTTKNKFCQVAVVGIHFSDWFFSKCSFLYCFGYFVYFWI